MVNFGHFSREEEYGGGGQRQEGRDREPRVAAGVRVAVPVVSCARAENSIWPHGRLLLPHN